MKRSFAKFFYITLLSIFSLTVACAQNTETRSSPANSTAPQLKWDKIELPFDVYTLSVKDNALFAFGSDEFGTINAGKFETLGKYRINKSYKFDGRNLTHIEKGIAECVPSYAAFAGGFFYIRSECDHGGQILRVDPAKNASTESIYISYRAEDHRSGRVLGPADSLECNGRYLIPAYNDKAAPKPVLLTPDYAKPSFGTIWEGSKQPGTIAAAACSEGRGWFANDDELFVSENTGDGDWHYLAKLPNAGGELKDLRFADKERGCLIRKNAVFTSIDGGKTWRQIGAELEDDLEAIAVDKGRIVITGAKGLYFVSGDKALVKLNQPEGVSLNSTKIFGDMIFAVSRGNVYTAKLPF